MSAPPAHPKRAKQLQRVVRSKLQIGMWIMRDGDHAVYQVRNVWRADRECQLAPDFGGDPIVVNFNELEREWKVVSPW